MSNYEKKIKFLSTFLLIMGFICAFFFSICLICLLFVKEVDSIVLVGIIFGFISVGCFCLSYISKKNPEKIFSNNINNNNNNKRYSQNYKAEWFYMDVYSKYCRNHNIKEVTSEEELKKIWAYTLNSLSVFLTWLIDNDLFIYEDEEIKDEAKKLKERMVSANEFFADSCSLCFSIDDVRESAKNFVADYFYFGEHKYGNYEDDYNNFIKNKLHKDVNEIVFDWNEYEQFKLFLDKVYDNYNIKIKEEKNMTNLSSHDTLESCIVEFPFFVNVYKNDDEEPLELKGSDAYNFLNNNDIEMVVTNFKNSYLYNYFNDIGKKIVSMEMEFTENGYIDVIISVREVLSEEEKQILLNKISGQLSDGWGESEFEFKKESGEIYELVFWKSEDWNINYV